MTPAIDALKRLGATDPVQLGYRASFALAGYIGEGRAPWITQKSANRGLGPSEIYLKFYCQTKNVYGFHSRCYYKIISNLG